MYNDLTFCLFKAHLTKHIPNVHKEHIFRGILISNVVLCTDQALRARVIRVLTNYMVFKLTIITFSHELSGV